mmetsp:Transcript_84284/g.181750  ORF Transcript_84284/g.181750 Transcript_84284/m.181750 type:complete len:118 (+) Transcript_84284:1415-1768(+)
MFTLIDKENLNHITYESMVKFLTDNNLHLDEADLREFFDKLDKNKDGVIDIQEFKYNIKKELQRKSQIQHGFAEDKDDVAVCSEVVSTTDENGEFIEFLCNKEPRHEFFSSLKKKKR